MIKTGQIKAIHDTKFDGIYIGISINEFNNLGFEFGDSVDLYFSNSFVVKDCPYYDGYYIKNNEYDLCGYSSYAMPCLSLQGINLWKYSKLSENDTVEVILNTKYKYKSIQDAFKQFHPSNKDYYVSDVAFANFRELKSKNIKKNFIFRGGSPICNDFGFMHTVNELMKQYNIQYVINLSETKEQLKDMVLSSKEDYITNLYNKNKIIPLDISAFPRELKYAQKLVKGLNEMIINDGPVYIHCMEGKDRTGFLCVLLLALTDGTYDDFLKDYMETYKNFYYVDEINTPDKYKAIKDLYFDYRMMNDLCDGENIQDLSKYCFKDEAIKYLKYGGMSDFNIQKLIKYISL